MLVKINVEEVLEFVQEGKDCKVEINQDGEAYVLPIEAAGYDDTVLTQYFDADDYEECESKEDYIDWLKDSFQSADLETADGIVEVEFVK